MTKQQEIAFWAYDWLVETYPDISDFSFSCWRVRLVVEQLLVIAPHHREIWRKELAIFSALYAYIFCESRDFDSQNGGGSVLYGMYLAGRRDGFNR